MTYEELMDGIDIQSKQSMIKLEKYKVFNAINNHCKEEIREIVVDDEKKEITLFHWKPSEENVEVNPDLNTV